jgi:hypothetical protein
MVLQKLTIRIRQLPKAFPYLLQIPCPTVGVLLVAVKFKGRIMERMVTIPPA